MISVFQQTVIKKACAGIFALTALTGLSACTDEEVATTLGVIAIGAGAIIIDANTPDRGRCEGGWVERCTVYRDYWGRPYRECRSEYDSCYRYRRYSNFDLNTFDLNSTLANSKLKEVPVEPGRWAQNFKMSFKAADLFTNTLVKARAGDTTALSSFGFSNDDIKALTQNKMPSDQGLDILAKRLNQSVSDTKAMFQALINEGVKLKKKECRKFAGPRHSFPSC